MRVGFSSSQLSRVSAEARQAVHGDREKFQQEFEALRWDFALFTNLYEFPLFSNQQQGLEMYELAREHMDVEQLFREIQAEIRSSHDYLDMRAGQEQAQMATRLTVVATIGLVIALVTSFFGMNIIIDAIKGEAPYDKGDFLYEALFLILVSLFFFKILIYCYGNTKKIVAFFERMARCIRNE